MTFLQRPTGLRARTRVLLILAAAAAAAAFLMLGAGHGTSARASSVSTAQASYAALTSQQPSGLTLVTSHERKPGVAPHPTWPAQPPAGASPHWPDASTIRPVKLSVPGFSAWIAASLEGGVCMLLYDGEPVEENAAVYSSCSAEGSLANGAGMDIESIPGKPGVVIDAGVVPNGVTAVTVPLANGKTETLAVNDNAWARESEEPMAPGQRPAWTTGG
jgi:hypothetical protein